MTTVTLQQIGDLIGNNWWWIMIALLSLVEVSKIKINPWSRLFRWIGDLFMADVKRDIADLSRKMGSVQSDIDELKKESKESEIKAARNRILRFGDEVYQGVRHSKEYFDQIMDDISAYNNYCEHHPDFKNEMTVMTVRHIESIYQRCLAEHDFL